MKRRFEGNYRWEEVELLEYKAEGAAPFREVTRQVLFEDPLLAAQWRYFEVGPGGHTTLERHQHLHAVMILRGEGQVLVGEQVYPFAPHDLITIPTLTWHQFRASNEGPMGFLCLVNAERDRPQLPTAQQLQEMKQNPLVAQFLEE